MDDSFAVNLSARRFFNRSPINNKFMMLIRYTFPMLVCLLTIAHTAQSQCTTDAGTISGAPFHCEGNSFNINNMADETLDANDILIFVAYTGDVPNAANVFVTTTDVNFPYQSSFLTNSPFKVAAVAGNDAGGTVDWDDPCLSVSNVLEVTYFPQIQANITSEILTCLNPSATLAVTVNQPNCFFSWGNGATQPAIEVLQPGTYCVTVSNQGGCTATECAVVAMDVQLPVCDAGPDMLINCANTTVILNGNQSSTGSNFTFQWSGIAILNGGQTLTPTVGAAGTYTLVVTNTINGCTASDQVQVLMDTNTPIADAGPDLGIPCGGGVVTLAGTGTPVGQITFSWSSPNGFNSTLQNPIVSQSGTYTLTVTSVANGCTDTDDMVVFPGPAIPQQNFAVSNATCLGVNTGSIDMTPPAAGQPPFNIIWVGPGSFVATTEDINSLAAGTYSVVVTDNTGCSYHANVEVGQAAPITIPPNQISVGHIACAGSADGAITFTIVGGTPPYSVNFDYNGTPSAHFLFLTNQVVFSNRPAGVYIFTATDGNGCSAVSQPIVITQPATPFVITTTPINCGDNSVQVNVTGGTPPYAYQWSNGWTTPIITNLPPGIYTLTVTDANGCQQFVVVTIDPSGNPLCGFIMGKVVKDSLNNCVPDPGELGLANWIVRADDVIGNSYYGVTDSSGTYRISVDEGDYTLALFPPSALWLPCFVTLPLGAVVANDTTFADDFLAQPIATCPAMSVTIGTNLLRRCFSNNFYFVNYCNDGTADAENVYVLVTLDPFLSPISASLPYTDLGNNVLRFDIGDVAVGQCGYFSLKVQVSCDAVIGQMHCTEAHIYPDSICLPNDPLWSGASLQITSQCDLDSVRFTIKNVGMNDMTEAVDYIVVEDMVMFMQSSVQLDAGGSVVLTFPANGSTWYVQVDQVSFHPGFSQPALALEGCSTTPSFSTGMVSQFPLNDADPWIDIDCTANVGSYDPNDKQGFPVGYGAAHYIRPGTELEYLIRFQNTGTDTAFTVRIVDTLSAWLDPVTIRPGASSHEYHFNLTGPGVVEFLYENILLPDSNVNEPASNGFVKFSIRPKEDAPLETLIENNAAIYFDFNEPVVTNTVFHRLGENFVVRAWQPFVSGAEVLVSPNPFGDEARMELKGLRSSAPLRLRVFDLQGTPLRDVETTGSIFTLRKGDWPAGVYIFQIQQEGKLVGSGKLVVK